MRSLILGLLLGAAAWAQAPPSKGTASEQQEAAPEPQADSRNSTPERTQKPPQVRVITPETKRVCSIPLKNVLPAPWLRPGQSPDERMLRPVPPAARSSLPMRQIPLPAPSCDDVK